jgi:hypothetical protein
LHLALDLGNTTWKLAFATSIAHAPRVRTMPARDLAQLACEIAAAKARFGLPADALVVSGYEAGRDGFWVHRALTASGAGHPAASRAATAATSGTCRLPAVWRTSASRSAITGERSSAIPDRGCESAERQSSAAEAQM